MRKTLLKIFLGTLLLLPLQVGSLIMADYKFEKKYLQEWNLADKSSTLQAKQEHIDKFVQSLEKGYDAGDFASNNALFLKTSSNEFVANLTALKSLQERLKVVEKMDPNSFEYNTAIQQITAQEQGEASSMINVFLGCYALENYPLVWSWIGAIVMLVWMFLGCLGTFILFMFWSEFDQ